MLGGHPLVMGYARNLVSKTFAAIDVKIDWRWRKCPADAIRITLQARTPVHQRPDALAYAMPYEGKQIVIFYDRVLEEVDAGRVPALMGHVIAHEIAHVLEGVNRHSATGIMKEHWNADDYLEMAWKPLPLAPEDIILIHRGLDSRRRECRFRIKL